MSACRSPAPVVRPERPEDRSSGAVGSSSTPKRYSSPQSRRSRLGPQRVALEVEEDVAGVGRGRPRARSGRRPRRRGGRPAPPGAAGVRPANGGRRVFAPTRPGPGPLAPRGHRWSTPAVRGAGACARESPRPAAGLDAPRSPRRRSRNARRTGSSRPPRRPGRPGIGGRRGCDAGVRGARCTPGRGRAARVPSRSRRRARDAPAVPGAPAGREDVGVRSELQKGRNLVMASQFGVVHRVGVAVRIVLTDEEVAEAEEAGRRRTCPGRSPVRGRAAATVERCVSYADRRVLGPRNGLDPSEAALEVVPDPSFVVAAEPGESAAASDRRPNPPRPERIRAARRAAQQRNSHGEAMVRSPVL